METIINNWSIIVAVIVMVAVAAMLIYRFFKRPTQEQLEKVKEWLLWAVTEAEKDLGGGTGKLKLRQVYDLFITRFPSIAMLLPFAQFSDLVDEALEQMRDMLATNHAVKALVTGGGGASNE